jgi:hypothetical protein
VARRTAAIAEIFAVVRADSFVGLILNIGSPCGRTVWSNHR